MVLLKADTKLRTHEQIMNFEGAKNKKRNLKIATNKLYLKKPNAMESLLIPKMKLLIS